MQSILDRLEQLEGWKELMRISCRANGLPATLAGDLTVLKVRQLEDRFKKSILYGPDKNTRCWIQNQLRTFNWLLLAQSTLSNTLIKDFSNEQWITLQRAFPSKNGVFLKFQARKLIEAKNIKNKNWSKDEEEMLANEVSKFDSDNICWNQVAHRMFEASGEKVFRNGKHCREHWLNHLDPHKQRGAWTIEEDIFLLDNVAKIGKKWSQLAVPLKRTEHSVKNRFNSLIIKQSKLTPHIKKEDRLIKEMRAKYHNVGITPAEQETHKEPSIQQLQAPERVEFVQMDKKMNINCFQEEPVRCEIPNYSSNSCNNEAQQCPPSDNSSQIKVQKEERRAIGDEIEVENPLSNYSPAMMPNCDLNFLIKEQKDMKKTVFSEFPIYSPYSPYIISPNTPSSYAGPVIVNNPFYNYFNAFLSMTDLSKNENLPNNNNQ